MSSRPATGRSQRSVTSARSVASSRRSVGTVRSSGNTTSRTAASRVAPSTSTAGSAISVTPPTDRAGRRATGSQAHMEHAEEIPTGVRPEDFGGEMSSGDDEPTVGPRARAGGRSAPASADRRRPAAAADAASSNVSSSVSTVRRGGTAPASAPPRDGSDRVRVAVRLRPFAEREIALRATSVITIEGQECWINHPENAEGNERKFVFDYCYDSLNGKASQASIFKQLGMFYLDNAWAGYNASIFAYGQTGSGKTYTMTGSKADPGIVPLGMRELFHRIETFDAEAENVPAGTQVRFVVECSFLEIYNETITDLLNPLNEEKLKVRESAAMGIFVQGLSKELVRSYDEIERCMNEGNKVRSVAATAMNKESSRSHSILTMYFTRVERDESVMNEDGEVEETHITSKINLVDLAGSERQAQTKATGERFKEAIHINLSLSALGAVIAALAEDKKFVPYRESVLTRLLQESLGGNSRTIMVAALSPADVNYNETLSTLRFASRVKKVVNVAKKNVSAKDALIAELRAEIERLRAMLEGGTRPGSAAASDGGMTARGPELLAAAEMQLLAVGESMEQKMRKTEEIDGFRRAMLARCGVSIAEIEGLLEMEPMPYLVNLSVDPVLNETLCFLLAEGDSAVGQAAGCNIVLKGDGVDARHCVFHRSSENRVTLSNSPGSATFVNGELVPFDGPVELHPGDRVFLGRNYFFRFLMPGATRGPGAADVPTFTWEDAVAEIASIHNLGRDMSRAVALVVVIEQGRGLAKMDTFGSSDPFCLVTLGDRRAKTPVLKKTLAPVWNYEICWPGPFVDPNLQLRVVCWDWDRYTRNDYMGEFSLALSRVPIPDGIASQWFALTAMGAGPAAEQSAAGAAKTTRAEKLQRKSSQRMDLAAGDLGLGEIQISVKFLL